MSDKPEKTPSEPKSEDSFTDKVIKSSAEPQGKGRGFISIDNASNMVIGHGGRVTPRLRVDAIPGASEDDLKELHQLIDALLIELEKARQDENAEVVTHALQAVINEVQEAELNRERLEERLETLKLEVEKFAAINPMVLHITVHIIQTLLMIRE